MSEFDVNQALAMDSSMSRDDEVMEVGDLWILEDSKELAEQHMANVDKSEVVDMIVNSGDEIGKLVLETIDKDSVANTGKTEVTGEEEEEEEAEEP